MVSIQIWVGLYFWHKNFGLAVSRVWYKKNCFSCITERITRKVGSHVFELLVIFILLIVLNHTGQSYPCVLFVHV